MSDRCQIVSDNAEYHQESHQTAGGVPAKLVAAAAAGAGEGRDNMIRFISDPEHGEFTASASGNISEVVVEIGVCINTAYNLLRSRDPDAAQGFKQALLVTFRPDSPVWDKEECKLHYAW